MNDAVCSTSLKVFSEYCLKITKTIRNVVADAMTLHVMAFTTLLRGFSLLVSFPSCCFFRFLMKYWRLVILQTIIAYFHFLCKTILYKS